MKDSVVCFAGRLFFKTYKNIFQPAKRADADAGGAAGNKSFRTWETEF